jgi:hypothetical protein
VFSQSFRNPNILSFTRNFIDNSMKVFMKQCYDQFYIWDHFMVENNSWFDLESRESSGLRSNDRFSLPSFPWNMLSFEEHLVAKQLQSIN